MTKPREKSRKELTDNNKLRDTLSQSFARFNAPLATLVLCLISCLDMEQQHDDKSKPADHIKPKLICIGDNNATDRLKRYRFVQKFLL